MKIFLDTANFESIKKAQDNNLLDGVTTNPSLLNKEISHGNKTSNNKDNLINLIQEISKTIYPKPISVEITQTEPKDVYAQAKKISKLAQNIIVKIPCHKKYIPVIKDLTKDKINLNITLLFSLNQAMLMCKLGVNYISPFIARLDDIGQNGLELIYHIKSMLTNYKFNTQLIAASIRSLKDIEHIIKTGIDIATIPPQLLDKMADHPLTDKGIELFDKDWQKLNVLDFP